MPNLKPCLFNAFASCPFAMFGNSLGSGCGLMNVPTSVFIAHARQHTLDSRVSTTEKERERERARQMGVGGDDAYVNTSPPYYTSVSLRQPKITPPPPHTRTRVDGTGGEGGGGRVVGITGLSVFGSRAVRLQPASKFTYSYPSA